MRTPEAIASAAICIPIMLLAGCNDFRIKNELKDPYNVSLTIKNKSHVSFSCEEGYLTKISTDVEILNKVDNLAEKSCTGNFVRINEKIKSLTINPGEYYHKVSASYRCEKQLAPDFEISAEQLCRSLLGTSYRSLSARCLPSHRLWKKALCLNG